MSDHKQPKFYLNSHKKLNSKVISICDKDLLNQTFESEDIRIEIDENFYKGEVIDEATALDYMKKEKNLNLVGKNVVRLGIKNKIIKKENVIYVNDIPVVYLFEV